MPSGVLDVQRTLNRFLVAVSSIELMAEMQRSFQAIDAENRKAGRDWQYSFAASTPEGLATEKEGLLYIIAEIHSPDINVTTLIRHFQVPIFLVSHTKAWWPGNKSPFEILANENVWGYLEAPTCEELFGAILNMHRTTVYRKALLQRDIIELRTEEGEEGKENKRR